MSTATGQTTDMAESETVAALDEETSAALTLFNEYVAADRERTRREKQVKKAERAKDEAAARVKTLSERGGSPEEKQEAEAAYREASERWRHLRDGGTVDESRAETSADDDATADEAAPTGAGDAESPVEADATTAETDRTDDDAEDAAGEDTALPAAGPAGDEAE